ncbi:MAG: hypothetical protein ABI867_13100 [Kofleriaceae bacterium]
MGRLLWFGVAAAMIVAGSLPGRAGPPVAPRYPDVQPLFEARCASCHDARKSANPPAQAVFEMSLGYPFATQRPATLLEDLRRAVKTRFLDEAEQRRAIAWAAAGALDAEGQPPSWR